MIGYQLPSVSRMRNKLIPSVMDKAGSDEDPASFDFINNYSGYLVIKKHVWLYYWVYVYVRQQGI